MIIFYFMIIMLKIFVLKINLNKISKNASTCTRFLTLQNVLQIDKISIFEKKLINEFF
jgi:hypothetical protein